MAATGPAISLRRRGDWFFFPLEFRYWNFSAVFCGVRFPWFYVYEESDAARDWGARVVRSGDRG
jgi:hypothetical protein